MKIGVLDDMSGPYAENTGPGDVLAVRIRHRRFRRHRCSASRSRWSSADFQSKVDVGVGIAKRWYDEEQVDMIIGIPNSAIALGVVKVAEEKNRIVMPTAAATSALTGKSCCGPNSVHWIYDTYGQTKTIVNALMKQGGDTWFFITVDYAFGLAIEQDATRVHQGGGRQGAGLGAASAEHRGLLLLPAAGAGLEGQGADGRQRRQRHHQRRQAGGRVRPDRSRACGSARRWRSIPTCTASA